MYKRGKTDTEFDYDGEGLRHEMEENGKLFTFIFRGTEIVAEESKEDKIRYIRTGELLASDAESARTYYHYASDEMGSITYVAAGEEKESGNCTGEGITGSILNRYEYDAWGNLITCEEKSKNRFKYNGQQHDQISGQYYLRARYYNPVIGRFTQEDTYRGDGLNLYAYCKNNPVYYVDPSGHICETEANRIMDKFGANGECGASRNEQKKLARYLRNKDRKGGNLSDNERRILNQIDDYTYLSRYDNQDMPSHLTNNSVRNWKGEDVKIPEGHTMSPRDLDFSEKPIIDEGPYTSAQREGFLAGDSAGTNLAPHHRHQIPVRDGGVIDELPGKGHPNGNQHTAGSPNRHPASSVFNNEPGGNNLRNKEIRNHWKDKGKRLIEVEPGVWIDPGL